MNLNSEIKQYFHKKYFNKFCENFTTLYTKEQGQITLPADDIHIDVVTEKITKAEDAKLVRVSIWLDYVECAFLDFTCLKPLTSQGVSIRLYGNCKRTCVKLGSRVNIEVDSELQKRGRLYIAKEDEEVDSTMIITQLEFDGDDIDPSRTEYISIEEYNTAYEKRRAKYRKKLNIPFFKISVIAMIGILIGLVSWLAFYLVEQQNAQAEKLRAVTQENEALEIHNKNLVEKTKALKKETNNSKDK
ncbi:hypothetical protein AAEX28_07705 [Lentisphaerota bacterium WC36G]|nr:hypothetical protein LJT99_10565 [Lentisphaerae bacterium WC36]